MYDQFLMYLTLTLAQPTGTGSREFQCAVVVSDYHHHIQNDGLETDVGTYNGVFHAMVFKIHRPQESVIDDPVVDISSLAINEDGSPETVALDFSLSSSAASSPRSSSEESD